MVRDFVDQWPGDERVALIASCCFAMDVGGALRGWTDEEWVEAVSGWILSDQYRELSTHATAERMAAAGNNSTEILNWVALTGAVGDVNRSPWMSTTAGVTPYGT